MSIVMSVFNEECWVTESLSSLINQTYRNLEIILVDDGSTDATVELVQKICQADSRVHLFRNSKNIGLPASLNVGISIARGDYIARMDADDVADLKRIEKQVNFLDSHPEVGILGTWCYKVIEGSNEQSLWKRPVHHAEILFNEMANASAAMVHPTVMMRRDVLPSRKPYNESYSCAQDKDLWSRLLLTTRFQNLAEPLLNYRVREKSISGSRKSEQRRLGASLAVNLVQKKIPNKWSYAELMEMLSYDNFPISGENAAKWNFMGVILKYLESSFNGNDARIIEVLRRKMATVYLVNIFKSAMKTGKINKIGLKTWIPLLF